MQTWLRTWSGNTASRTKVLGSGVYSCSKIKLKQIETDTQMDIRTNGQTDGCTDWILTTSFKLAPLGCVNKDQQGEIGAWSFEIMWWVSRHLRPLDTAGNSQFSMSSSATHFQVNYRTALSQCANYYHIRILLKEVSVFCHWPMIKAYKYHKAEAKAIHTLWTEIATHVLFCLLSHVTWHLPFLGYFLIFV